MNKIIGTIGLLSVQVFALNDGFNFSECSGSGSFEQQIIQFNQDGLKNYENAVTVGEIPTGIQGLKVSLESDNDVDIRLYAGDEKLVHWPYGLLSQDREESTDYKNTSIKYSGYNGIDGEKGHESIEVTGTIPSTFTMKAFGYQAGYATVNYSWTGTEGCTQGGDTPGEGNFTQSIAHDALTLVGEIPSGIPNVYIKLTSDKDLDIQLYGEDGTVIVGWKPKGLLNGPTKSTVNYHNMNIEWSGYNGDGTGRGHEYIKISGNTNENLTMKVYGYEEGIADVSYKWGDIDVDTNTVTKYVTLEPGYNGVHFDTDLPLAELVAKIGFENLLVIQGAGQGTAYKKSLIDQGLGHLNSFTQSEYGKGYFIKVAEAVTFSYASHVQEGTQTINLKEGYNLLGMAKSLSVAELKAQLGEENVLAIKLGNDEEFTGSILEEGKAYWVKLANDDTLDFDFGQAVTKYVTLEPGYNGVHFDTDLPLAELVAKIGFENLLVIQGAGQGTAYKKSLIDQGLGHLNSFTQSEYGKGYFIKVAEAVTFSYASHVQEGTQTINLKEGYNLLGMAKSLSVAELKAQLGEENVLAIKIGDSEEFTGSVLEEGKAYWVKLANADTLDFDFGEL